MPNRRARARPRIRPRVRWAIFAFLFAFTFMAYVQRTAISVAAIPIMPALGLSQVQIGWLETAFLVSYTALQLPGALVGQAIGARAMFTASGAIAVAATLAIPILPSMATGTWLFVALLAAQFMLGAMQAPLFAILTATLQRWFPRRQWALTQGLTTGGVGLGGAAAPPLIASLMVLAGWRWALVLVALPAIPLVALWWWHGRDQPHHHRKVTADELAELDAATHDITVVALSWQRLGRLLTNPHLAGLTLSYLAMNIVFYLITNWSFLYLVQARHFSLLQSGLATSLPLLAGALGAALGGFAASAASARFGPRRGLRLVPLLTLPAAGILLLLSVQAHAAGWALAGLSLAFGLLEMNEACFWAAAMEIGSVDAGAASAILNTGGNLGGIIATPTVAALSMHGDWSTPFTLGAAGALVSAAIWLLITPQPPSLLDKSVQNTS